MTYTEILNELEEIGNTNFGIESVSVLEDFLDRLDELAEIADNINNNDESDGEFSETMEVLEDLRQEIEAEIEAAYDIEDEDDFY